jgi:hypothetical protein
MAPGSYDNLIGTDHSKRNLARDFLRFCDGLLVFVLVGGCLENMDVVIGYVRQNLGFRVSNRGSITEVMSSASAYPGLEFRDLVIRQGICLGDDRNKVDFGMKPTHDLNIEGFQPIRQPSLRTCVLDQWEGTHA